jgi:hypothetical protein
MLAHTLSFALAVAILNPTYSKKKTNNREPDIEAYEIETLLGNKLTTLEAWSRGEERRYLICGLWVCGSGWPETTDDDAQEYFTVASFLLLLLLRPLLQTLTNTPQVAGGDPINPRCEQWRGRMGCELRMRRAKMEQGSRRQPSSGGRRVEGGSWRSNRDGADRRRECVRRVCVAEVSRVSQEGYWAV